MPIKRAEYRLAPAATHDLEGIWVYTLEEWGIDQAHRYIDELTAAFVQLANNPQLGAACDYIRKGYRRRRVGLRYATVFGQKRKHLEGQWCEC